MPELKTESLELPVFEAVAAKLAHAVAPQDVLALHGNLGAGKTTFSRAFIKTLLPNEPEITSPTFNLVQVYNTPAFDIWHYDLYRLKSAEELVELGLDEALTNGVSLIEWPEIAKAILPNQCLEIFIEDGKKQSERILTFIYSDTWKDRIHAIFNR